MILPRPLRPWLWTCLWLLLISAASSYIYLGQGHWRAEIVRLYLKETHFTLAQNSPYILILGDSLVRRSFPRDQDEQTLFGAGVHWGKVWIPGGSYLDFKGVASVLPEQFGVILISQDVLLRNEFWSRKRTFRGFLAMMRRTFKYQSIVKSVNHQQQLNRPCTARPDAFTKKVIENQKNRYLQVPVLSSDAIGLLRELNSKAEKVIVLRLPRSESLEEQLEPILSQFQARLVKALADEGIQLVELGPAMPDSYYCDGSHPNKQGREVRTQQLISLMRERLLSTW